MSNKFHKQEQELKHFGIRGMKWGIRGRRLMRLSSSNKNIDTGEVNARSRMSSTDSRIAGKLRGRKLNELSNEELKTLTTRLSLEKQYKELTKVDPKPGAKFVGEVLQSAGKQLAAKYIANFAEKGGERLINAILKKKD